MTLNSLQEKSTMIPFLNSKNHSACVHSCKARKFIEHIIVAGYWLLACLAGFCVILGLMLARARSGFVVDEALGSLRPESRSMVAIGVAGRVT